MNVLKRLSGNKKVWVLVIMAILVAVSSIGYSIWQIQAKATSKASTTSAYQTDKVRRGNISLSATGSGTLITSTSLDLGFATGGVLSQVNVQPGDQVTSGQELAVLDGISELKQAVTTKELALEEAQNNLNDLLDSADKNLAEALLSQAQAQATQVWAKNHVYQKSTSRCSTDTIRTYLLQYLHDSADYNDWSERLKGGSGYGESLIRENMNKYAKKKILTYENWKYCEGYTDLEVTASKASLDVANATLDEATAIYEKLKTNKGLDPTEIAIAQAKVTNAENELTSAKTDLDGSTITAPMDGTVIEVDYKVGQTIPDLSDKVVTVITIADLKHPQLKVYIDQVDLQNFQVNCKANVGFDALSGQTFTGTVTSVYPEVTDDTGADTLEGIVQLDDTTSALKQELPLNLPATVDVVCSEANDVLIISVNGIYNATSAAPYVYVLNSLGQPEKREVKIGIMNDSFAEIKSGLSEGEQVISESIE
jgi:HlyD family secretion protein